MGIRPSDRHDGPVWDLAVPAVLALAADPLLGVVDTAFVGRLGPEALVGSLWDRRLVASTATFDPSLAPEVSERSLPYTPGVCCTFTSCLLNGQASSAEESAFDRWNA